VAEKLVHQAQAVCKMRRFPSAPHGPHAFPSGPATCLKGEVELYFDIEAAPDQNLIYLHGVLVVDHRTGKKPSIPCWRSPWHQERRAWEHFLDLVHAYPHAPVYHFCPYEAQTVRRLTEHYGTPAPGDLTRLLIALFDIHWAVTESVTLPIESYALKHIARWMGFDWRDEGANGAQSICWYNEWAGNRRSHLPRGHPALQRGRLPRHLPHQRLAGSGKNSIKPSEQTRQAKPPT
jgi:predicted RecB family nuclease